VRPAGGARDRLRRHLSDRWLGIPRIAADAIRRAVIRGFNVVTDEFFDIRLRIRE